MQFYLSRADEDAATKAPKDEGGTTTTEDLSSSFSNPLFGKEPTVPPEKCADTADKVETPVAAKTSDVNNEVENPLFDMGQQTQCVEHQDEPKEQDVKKEPLGNKRLISCSMYQCNLNDDRSFGSGGSCGQG